MADNRKIDRYAARQHGVFSAAQARSAGFDKHAVARRVVSGAWQQLDYRVFALSSAAATWERQLWVALLSRPRAVVGGRTAASLHGFRGFPHTKPTIIVPGSGNARSTIARVIRSEHFDELDVVQVRGFPMTSIAETLLTLAGELSLPRFEETLDDLLLSGRVGIDLLVPLVEREAGRRRRGILSFRDLVIDRLPDAPSRDSSYLERLLERLLRKAVIPEWHREHPFTLSGQTARVDVFIPPWALVIEVDGRNWHARVAAFETDRSRDNELAARGIQVLRFTYRMITADPAGCLETIASVGRVRSA